MVSGLRLRPGTVGQPYIGIRSKILNPDPQTGIGEIAARARNVFMGFHNCEDKTKEVFTEGK